MALKQGTASDSAKLRQILTEGSVNESDKDIMKFILFRIDVLQEGFVHLLNLPAQTALPFIEIIDGSSLRRGRPTVNAKYGINDAIVVGDYLFAKAYELGSRYGPAG